MKNWIKPLLRERQEEYKTFIIVAARVLLICGVIYGSANWWAVRAPYQMRFWMDWELGLPFIPWMIAIYVSLYFMFFLPAFLLSKEEIKAFGQSVIWATVVAGIIFFILPAPAGFQRPNPSDIPLWGPIFSALYSIDEKGNTLPSLHVTYTLMLVLSLSKKHKLLKLVLYPWMLGIFAAVILVWQHHIADIFGGTLLGWLIIQRFYEPKASSSISTYKNSELRQASQ